jgi:hypothetical protein
VLWSLASPADNARGPQYLAAAMTALHRAFRGGSRCELLIARHAGHVGLYARTTTKLSPLTQGQLQSAYPDLRIEAIEEGAFAPKPTEFCTWARLRLVPAAASLVPLETLLDHQEHQLVDPLASVFAAVSSRKTDALRPMVSILARPAGWLTQRRARRKIRGPEKLRGPLWIVDVRLAVIARPSHRDAAIAKLHELSGAVSHFLPVGDARMKLSRIRRGTLPRRLPWHRRWMLSPAELAMLWHPPTVTVRTPQLRTNESRELEPPTRDQLPTIGKYPELAVLGRAAFRERRETFGMLP